MITFLRKINSIRTERRSLIPLLLIALGIFVYSNSIQFPFVFDDDTYIAANPHIRRIISLENVLLGVPRRPFITFSLALNYHFVKLSPWGYRLTNILIHCLSATLLFGIIRRTLSFGDLDRKYGNVSIALALASALIWLVHPLHTQSVTYIIQRCESFMGFFFLATLYCAIRGFQSPTGFYWLVMAVTFCAFGMGTKESMVGSPIVVFLYDALFISKSFKKPLASRAPFYLGLFSTWAIVIALFLDSSLESKPISNASSLRYLTTQTEIITHYLKLAIWPKVQVFDYGWPLAETFSKIIPHALFLAAVLSLSLWACWKKNRFGFLGLSFFLVLAPTSSIYPLSDAASEQRMYLPLAIVIVFAVLSGYQLLQFAFTRTKISNAGRAWISYGIVLTSLLMFSTLTIQRNTIYRSAVSLWSDTVAKRPQNARAHQGLGIALFKRGNVDAAIDHFREAVRLEPEQIKARNHLGVALEKKGGIDEAIEQYAKALQINPNYYGTLINLGNATAKKGKLDKAIAYECNAISLNPNSATAYFNLGQMYHLQGRTDKAIRFYETALRLNREMDLGKN